MSNSSFAPVVSVIIPNYNHARFLPRRIDSVLNQTYSPLEVILLDDCSADNSREVIGQFTEQDRRIKAYYNQQNSGSPFKQWAKGIRLAKGDYIWIAESDDYAAPHFLEVLVNKLEQHPQAAMGYTQSWSVDEHGHILQSCRNLYPTLPADVLLNGKKILAENMAGANIIPNASAVVFRKALAQEIEPSYQQFRFSGDWWFWCQLLMKGDLIYVDQELNYFRVHGNKITTKALQNGLFFREALQVLDLLYRQKAIDKRIYQNKSGNLALQLARHGINSGLSGRIIGSILWQALLTNPFFLKTFVKQSIKARI